MNFLLQILLANQHHLHLQQDHILMVIDSAEDLLALVEDQGLLRQLLSLKQKIPDIMEALQDLDEPQEVPRLK